MKTSLFLGTALAALLVTGMASAAKKNYVAPEMTGDKEIPTKVNSAATAEARFTYDDVTKKLCGHITATPSTFEAISAHIHKGDATTSGPVEITLSKDGFKGELIVNQVLTDDEAKALDADAYVNVHTDKNQGGELRAQLDEDGDTTAAPEECDDGESDAGTAKPDSGPVTTAKPDGGTTATPATTDDGGGCSTTGSSNTGSGIAIAAGLGLVLAAASRKRKKA